MVEAWRRPPTSLYDVCSQAGGRRPETFFSSVQVKFAEKRPIVHRPSDPMSRSGRNPPLRDFMLRRRYFAPHAQFHATEPCQSTGLRIPLSIAARLEPCALLRFDVLMLSR